MTGPRLSGDRTTCCGEKVIYQGGRGVCRQCQQWVDPPDETWTVDIIMADSISGHAAQVEEPRGVMHYVVGTGEIYYSDHYYD